jgi:hypothetical protein
MANIVAQSRRFALWNAFGVLDLVLALGLGALCSGVLPALTGELTTAPMAQLPLVLVPAYFVPIYLMLHFVAFARARRAARGGEGYRGAAPVPA